MTKTVTPIQGTSASMVPAPVATALPPRKPSQNGKAWPSTAATEASTAASAPPISPPIHAATAPLAMSSTITGTPTFGPSTRTAFVPPVLPLPTVRRSTPFSRPAQYPNGSEPSR